MVERRAKGVIFSIAPWNLAIWFALRSIALPIMCGNTIVFKCSEAAPRSQAIVVALLTEAGLPRGVLNFISVNKTDTPRLTKEIIAHTLNRAINFTGSDVVGRILASEAAKHLKPCVLELGGKAPAVVLDDADLPKAAKAVVSGALLNSGQACLSTERLIVQRKASETLIPQIVELMKTFTADDTYKNAQGLSALFSEASAAKIVAMVEEAQYQGAELLLGDGSRKGSVVQPHVSMGCHWA